MAKVEAPLERRLRAFLQLQGYLRPTQHMFRELVETCPRCDGVLSQEQISDLAAGAYHDAGHRPWTISAVELGDCFNVDISREPTDEQNVKIFSEIARSLLEPTNARGSFPDQCSLMLELAMPIEILIGMKNLRLSGPRLHLPAWFWRLGLARLPHSGLMAC
jgi:hypothetical protein